MLSGEATHINYIVFGLTPPGLEPTIYRTRGEHAKHYATDVSWLATKINTMIVTCRTCTASRSGEPLFTLIFFTGVRVAEPLLFCVMFCTSLFVLFLFGHCIVCPSIYGFWLPIWYLQTVPSWKYRVRIVLNAKSYQGGPQVEDMECLLESCLSTYNIERLTMDDNP